MGEEMGCRFKGKYINRFEFKGLKNKVSGGVLLALLQWLGFVTANQNHPNPHFCRNGQILLDFYLFLMDYGCLRLMCCWFCSGLSGICYCGSFGSCFLHPNLPLARVMQKSLFWLCWWPEQLSVNLEQQVRWHPMSSPDSESVQALH